MIDNGINKAVGRLDLLRGKAVIFPVNTVNKNQKISQKEFIFQIFSMWMRILLNLMVL